MQQRPESLTSAAAEPTVTDAHSATTGVRPSPNLSRAVGPTSSTSARLSSELSQLVVGLRERPIEEQQRYLLLRLEETLALSDVAKNRLRILIESSEWLSFGNPKVSEPAMTVDECRERLAQLQPGDAICGAPHMVALFDPKQESKEDARVCIDQYEFPNIPCEYPVVWTRANEAADICSAVGKRLCRAHEWEGGCAGSLLPAESEYPYDELSRVYDQPNKRRERRLQLEHLHNVSRQVRWAYGEQKRHELCATTGRKSNTCDVVDFSTCGTNDFPSGSFPECKSPLGVYDQHGNVAEHMSLPLYPEELELDPSRGWTEMKGSWFVFSREEAHPDDCRWRAKNWHTTRVDDPHSHRNYHLGFRCCRDLP